MSASGGPRRVLVTGATGFLGTRLVAALGERGHTVVAVGQRANVSFPIAVAYHAFDITTDPERLRQLMRESGSDVLVHLAGPVAKTAPQCDAAGFGLVRAHMALALAVRNAVPADFSGRVIFTSSMTVYGVPARLPILESDPRSPWHLYALAKTAAEDILLAWPDVDLWSLRLPGLFSADRREGGLFHFMRNARAGSALRVTADRPTPWDLLNVDDAVVAVVRAMESPVRRPGAINVSYGEPVEICEVAQWFADHAGRGSAVENATGVVHPRFQMDIARARELLAWPPATLHQRLAQLFAQTGDAP